MKYLITGGSGFIGKNFISSLNINRDSITILSRKTFNVGSNCTIIHNLSEIKNNDIFDCIINLAGSPIDCRWSETTKNILIDSRVDTTSALITLIKRLKNKPKIMISASAIGYYGNYDNGSLDEGSRPSNSFTHKLCDRWENEAIRAEEYGVRVCIARFGVVLGDNGGFIKKVLPPFKWGLGGRMGNGRQMFSWIHIEDVIKGFEFLISKTKCMGKYNFTSPNAVTNQQLTKYMGGILKRPTICHIPSLMIKILFGEMGEELLLKGNEIIPRRLLKEGYKFKYSEIESALSDILSVK